MSSCSRVTVIDCQMAGISGDMVVGALIDLGADVANVVEAMESVKSYLKECKNLKVIVKDVTRNGFHAKKVDIKTNGEYLMTGAELIDATMNCINNLQISSEAKRFASESIYTLANAEATVHCKNIEEVHLHEAGTPDTPAEIVGVAVALDELNLFNTTIYSTPVAVGGGMLDFSHGKVSIPAPASLEILRSKFFPMMGGYIESELATPTGISMLVNLAHDVIRFYPSMKPTAIGYGAGTKDFIETPNVLRITIGYPIGSQLLRDEIFVLETNLDDVTGEVVGHAMNTLLQEGAKDVISIPMFTKKNRPGQMLKIVADKTDIEHLSRILIEETGTLGVRVDPCERRKLGRESILMDLLINGMKERVNVKIAKDSEGKVVRIKPEYADLKRVAAKTNKPLREIMSLVEIKAREFILRR